MAKYEHLKHTFEPVWNKRSQVLILGTFPSVKSREQDFYYGHPQNRFWKVMGRLTSEDEPDTIAEKKSLLLKHGIAIWDVIESCDIIGSSDSSIRNVVPADVTSVLEGSGIRTVYGNGATAVKLYGKYLLEKTGVPIIGLPSTSPANAVYSIERLMEYWKQIGKDIK